MKDLVNPKTIKTLLAEHGAKPKKGLGQNFLTDKRALTRIVDAAQLSPQDTVIEIGPGLGTLTVELAKRAKKVIAIEKDQKLVEILQETLKEYRNVELIQGDVLKLSPKYQILNTKYKVVANLPYYITSPVIRKFLEAERKPTLMVLMVQKEVAQRICANPRTRTSSVRGRPPMNLLAVSVQFYGKPQIISVVKRTSFWPQPDVDSAILKITLKHAEPYAEPRRFFKIVKAGFKQPRKQLLGNLAKGLGMPREQVATWLKKNRVNPAARAETLPVETWVRLVKNLKKHAP